jgi:hypothetical protein
LSRFRQNATRAEAFGLRRLAPLSKAVLLAVEAVDVLEFTVATAAAVFEADGDDTSAEDDPVTGEGGKPPVVVAVDAVDECGRADRGRCPGALRQPRDVGRR